MELQEKPVRDHSLMAQHNVGVGKHRRLSYTIVVVSFVLLVIACFALICVNLSKTYIMHASMLEANRADSGKLDKISEAFDQTDPLKAFKYFFRTPLEFANFKNMREHTRQHINTTARSNCSFTCVASNTTLGPAAQPTPQKIAPTRVQQTLHHGCCMSHSEDVAPATAENLNGVIRTLVQVPDYIQYFVQDSCNQVAGCTGCQCSQPVPFIYRAVVYKNNNSMDFNATNMETDYIQIAGCCKCLNVP